MFFLAQYRGSGVQTVSNSLAAVVKQVFEDVGRYVHIFGALSMWHVVTGVIASYVTDQVK